MVLSDDEDAAEVEEVTVKKEQSESSDNDDVILNDLPPECIDLTDEAHDDTEPSKHHISWLAELIERAKMKPTETSASDDVIVIDDPQEISDANEQATDKFKTADESIATDESGANQVRIDTVGIFQF